MRKLLLASVLLAGCGDPVTRIQVDPDIAASMVVCAGDGRGAILTGGMAVDKDKAVYWRGDTAVYCEAGYFDAHNPIRR